MIPFGDNYKPTPIESDIFLSDVPMDLMQENIADQFDDPLEYGTDYISVFIDKYDLSREEIGDEGKDQLEEIRNQMFSFILKQFQDHYNIGIPEFEDLPMEDQNKIVMSLYRFFVLNIKKTLSRLVINYISKHGDELIDIGNRKKSVTYLSMRKEIDDPVALSVLSDISAVIDVIADSDMDVDEFLELAKYDNNSIEVEVIQDAYEEFKVTGNFTSACFDLLSFDLRQEIESKVRNKLMKKYAKRAKDVDPQDEQLEEPELETPNTSTEDNGEET